jgi:hypothetical protein
MSERLPIDKNKALEHIEVASENKDSLHDATKEMEQAETQRHSSELRESARKTIEQEAVSKETPLFEKQAEQLNSTPQYTTKQIKNDRYRTTLIHVQKHLSPTQRAFSKIVHQPFIEAASEIGAKTIGRPSGILSGGLIALFGSLSIMIIARRVGFEVPSSIFAIFFVGGFLIGIIIEAVYHRFKKPSKHSKI